MKEVCITLPALNVRYIGIRYSTYTDVQKEEVNLFFNNIFTRLSGRRSTEPTAQPTQDTPQPTEQPITIIQDQYDLKPEDQKPEDQKPEFEFKQDKPGTIYTNSFM